MIELWYSWSLWPAVKCRCLPPSDLAILVFTLFHRTYGTSAAHGDVTRWQHSSIRCGWRDVAPVEVFRSRSSEKENSCVDAECSTKDNDEGWHQMMTSGIRWDVYHSVAIINCVWLGMEWKDVNVKWIVVTYAVTAIQNIFVLLPCTWWTVSLCSPIRWLVKIFSSFMSETTGIFSCHQVWETLAMIVFMWFMEWWQVYSGMHQMHWALKYYPDMFILHNTSSSLNTVFRLVWLYKG